MKEPPQIVESRPVIMRMQLVDPEDPKRTGPRQEVHGTVTFFKARLSEPAQ